MKMIISRFTAKDIQTQRGVATVLNFQAGGKWYSSFLGSWNAAWENGAEIEVDSSQIKSNAKNGRTYLNIAAPAKSQAQAPSANGSANGDRVVNALIAIYKDLQAIKEKLGIRDEK